MNKSASDINWSEVSCPLAPSQFDKYTQQSIAAPIQCLGINEDLWLQCRSLAFNLSKQGFIDPISILYTSFKRYYSSDVTINSFTRWLLLNESNKHDFHINSIHYPLFSNLNGILKLCESTKELQLSSSLEHIDQIWFLFAISILIPPSGYTIFPDFTVLNNGITRLSLIHRRSTSVSRLHCLFALTPSGMYSNQLIVCKAGRRLKINSSSTSCTRIVETPDGSMSWEHVQQWLNDFLSLSYAKTNSAIFIDPRTSLLTLDFEETCKKSNLHIVTTDPDSYITHIVKPFFSLFDKQWSQANHINKIQYKSAMFTQRILHTIWYTLRTLKYNNQISNIFNKTILWKSNDEKYFQSLQIPIQKLQAKKKKKKSLVKIGSKAKLSPMMIDPPGDSTPEHIFSYILNRQISIARAGKLLGGIKLDYFKYCLSYKMNSSLITGSHLTQLNEFMQSKSTVDWLRRLRSLYFWSCAKQLFLREIYQLTGIINRKRSMNLFGNHNMGSIKICDQQSPSTFWRAFEELHQIQFDTETLIDDKQWENDFQKYLVDNKLNNEKTKLWTIDTFEFPLTKNSTILQLPEWNELRPMNVTPKVTVVYAFSNDGQTIEPYFIFPNALYDNTQGLNEHDSYNDQGYLTPQIFLLWIEKYFIEKCHSPIALIFCSRLPILSSTVLLKLEHYQIYPFGYPFTRTLPFRYLFERRVRNNRSTNLMSELWKKKLLDEQRTHVLKGENCKVKNIKYYFQQIWPTLINEKRDDDDESRTFNDKCQQAFQQANIQIDMNRKKDILEKTLKNIILPNKNPQHFVDQLNDLLNVINHMKEEIYSINILKIQNKDLLTMADVNKEAIELDNVQTTTTYINCDKRPSDENDEPRSSKRLRSSSANLNSSTAHIIQWIPPSNESIHYLQSQSATLFQFILSLVHKILISSDNHLTDEQCKWLETTVNLHVDNSSKDKINSLIEIACKIVKIDLVK